MTPYTWRDDVNWVKVAFAEIDWHDYAIVQTIEFTAADANSELPAPMSVQEVENMTLMLGHPRQQTFHPGRKSLTEDIRLL